MSPNLPTKSDNNFLKKAKSLVGKDTPMGIVEQISKQLARSDEASKRIEEEGIVVRDMKGSVIAHPAIKIEITAGKIITDLLMRYGK
jgi:hypothetical protein